MFKVLQVLRTTEKVRNTKGHIVNTGARVVVVHQKEDTVKVRYGTNKTDYRYIEAPVSAFTKSVRGRPVGSGKKVDGGGSNKPSVKASKKEVPSAPVEAPVAAEVSATA